MIEDIFPERLSRKDMRLFSKEIRLAGYQILGNAYILHESLFEPWRSKAARIFLDAEGICVYRARYFGLGGWERYDWGRILRSWEPYPLSGRERICVHIFGGELILFIEEAKTGSRLHSHYESTWPKPAGQPVPIYLPRISSGIRARMLTIR